MTQHLVLLHSIKLQNTTRTKETLHRAHQTPRTSLPLGNFLRRRRRFPIFKTNGTAPSVPPYSSSEDSEDSATALNNNKNRVAVEVDLEDLAAAEEGIAQQQAAGLPPSYDLAATKVKLNVNVSQIFKNSASSEDGFFVSILLATYMLTKYTYTEF